MADIDEQTLRNAVMHLVGQSRAFIELVEGARREIGNLHDDRAVRVLAALGQTLGEPAGPGTLRHVESAATELLRALRTEG